MPKKKTPPRAGRQPAAARRSPCPIACSLDIFGDRWSLLIIRDLLLGRSRYKDFASSPEGIPTNILAERLERLARHGLVTKEAGADGSRHPIYQLTEKGQALTPVLRAMKNWSLEWEPDTDAALANAYRMPGSR